MTQVRSEVPRYPIRAVAKMTGLSVDTLRAWERRYEVVSAGAKRARPGIQRRGCRLG